MDPVVGNPFRIETKNTTPEKDQKKHTEFSAEFSARQLLGNSFSGHQKSKHYKRRVLGARQLLRSATRRQLPKIQPKNPLFFFGRFFGLFFGFSAGIFRGPLNDGIHRGPTRNCFLRFTNQEHNPVPKIREYFSRNYFGTNFVSQCILLLEEHCLKLTDAWAVFRRFHSVC